MKTTLLILYILLILTVIFLERKTPTEALLWVLILICLPYAGVILYLIFGSTMGIRLTAGVRKKRLMREHPQFLAPHREEEPPEPPSEEAAQVIRFNKAYNGSPLTCYEGADFFTDGASHYRQLFRDIEEAREAIYLEFYTIHNDPVGHALTEALTRKAREGVKVLVMCDFIANLSVPASMYRPLRQAGGQVLRLKPYLTHYRSHRKIVVIDHRISYIGGMNIGRQYAGLAPRKTPWRDTQVRLTGPCTRVLEGDFLTDWLRAVPRRRWREAVAYADSVPREQYPLSRNLCQFVVGGVDNNKESVKMCYLSMIRSAKKRIRIQTPYFIPDASILDALKTAAAAGVEIELMIPGIRASFFLDPVTTYYAGQLLEYGARIYKYKGYIHAKTLTVDEALCCVGSVNLDMRSLELDDEVCGVFYGRELVSTYLALYDRDVDVSTAYTYKEFCARGTWEKIKESFYLLFAPIM